MGASKMTTPSRSIDIQAARGLQLCLLQLSREARALGLTFAAAHMDVAALEIADCVGDVTRDLGVQLSVANDHNALPAAGDRAAGNR
jgi:hypothetical protein